MICMGRQQSVAWIWKRLPADAEPNAQAAMPDFRALGYAAAGYKLPEDSGRKTSLAKTLYGLFEADAVVLVLVENCAIWPSSGHLPLLVRLRQALGEMREIDDVPGHLLGADEREDAVSVLVLAMQFYWDCWIVAEDGRRVLFVSHDEYYDFFADDAARVEDFKRLVGGQS